VYTQRILEARASLAGERKASWYPITDFGRSTPATTDSARALKALSQHVDADLGDMAFHDQDDDASDKEWDRESPELDQPAAMPTMYSNTFLGPLSVSSDEKSSAPFDRRPSTVPRDPVTGKVDVSHQWMSPYMQSLPWLTFALFVTWKTSGALVCR
jgi:hypothetical protein